LHVLAARGLVEQCPTAQGQIHGVGIVRPLPQSALTLSVDERDVQRAGDALSDVVLDLWEPRDLAIKSLRPELGGVRSLDELGVDVQ